MALISQQQNLEQFVRTQLNDIVDWSKHVRLDPEHETTGDVAHVLISTPYNRYKLAISSPYVMPPEGAPFQCRSLGTVDFYDPAEGRRILQPRGDQTWTDISKHMHVREYTDALAVARRQLAEASAEKAAESRANLATIAERAGKWLDPKVVASARAATALNWTPEELAVMKEAAYPIVTKEMADEIAKLPVGEPGAFTLVKDYTENETSEPLQKYLAERAAADPHKRVPHIGDPIVYVTNPGEAIGGQSEIPGWVVKVISPDRISAFITPDHSEPCYRDNLVRRGSDAGGGRVHAHNVWDFNRSWLAEQSRIKTIERDLCRALSDVEHSLKMVEELARKVATLEQKARTAAIAETHDPDPAPTKRKSKSTKSTDWAA